ncbi:ABC transporter permease [Flavobacteriaceae bacterium TP-CH-4]|uniref:ABC transporter permease n=1 Tax=Pelagihabitans pacificus TaxID=2696054 RepID=A0A967EBR9_9FLAO|nr:ABC transporter permease [Pelagihabitans pacificus]NHF60571.1 ABC transporter permease [Pelagihabitans pacificus]
MTTSMPYLDASSVETCFDIEPDCIFVRNDLLSESGLIENAAQSCAAIVAQSYVYDDENNQKIGDAIAYISAIKKIEVKKLPSVNERIVTKGKLLSRYDDESFSLCTMEATTFRKGELIVACTFNFLIHGIR